MKISEILNAKSNNMLDNKALTIAFLGDSVTQGCFELYRNGEESIETTFEPKNSYPQRLWEILHLLYPKSQINIINAGISGDSADGGLKRLDRDVLRFNPDVVVVAFGLNDAVLNNADGVESFKDNLRNIFTKIRETGAQVIYLSENAACKYVHVKLTDSIMRIVAENTAALENGGIFKKYFDAAAKVCEECGVKYCDMYSKWEKLAKNGVDTTSVLANYINHPIREYAYYIALKLFEILFEID